MNMLLRGIIIMARWICPLTGQKFYTWFTPMNDVISLKDLLIEENLDKRSCTCSDKDLFNYGCKCGFVEKNNG